MPLVASVSVIAKPSLTSTTDLVLDRTVQRPDGIPLQGPSDNYSAPQSCVITLWSGPQIKMNDAYVWADDAVRCYDLPIETLRDRYLNERLEGESAAQKDV